MTNVSNKPVQLPAKMVMEVISTANVVPTMIAPKTMLKKDWDQTPSQLPEPKRQKVEELVKGGSWWSNR